MKHATQPVRINRHLLRVICELVTGITLTLGLWPFHAPRNDVSWLQNQSGLHFGRFSTAFSSVEFRFKGPTVPASASLEIWLQPRRIWDFSTFLAFYTARRPSSFSLRQAQTSLLLQTAPPDGQARTERKDLYVEDVFRKNGPSYITITSGKSGTAVYLDGVMAKIAPQVGFSTEAFAGQLILGDSAGQGDSWSGELLGLSIYNQTLTGPEVLAHYRTWTQAGRPQLGGDPGNAALYLLDEHSGRTIHSNTGSGPDLQIPERYTVVGQVFLENPWVEFKRSQGLLARNRQEHHRLYPLRVLFLRLFLTGASNQASDVCYPPIRIRGQPHHRSASGLSSHTSLRRHGPNDQHHRNVGGHSGFFGLTPHVGSMASVVAIC
jgi:hypothetical protein